MMPEKKHSPKTQPATISTAEYFIHRLLALPRFTRILLAGFIALAATLLIFPVVDDLYIRFLFTWETRILPSLVSATIGLLVYMLGWQLIVGGAGETLPARAAVLWYVVGGLVVSTLVAVLLLYGFTLV